jgi:hypothetical protein
VKSEKECSDSKQGFDNFPVAKLHNFKFRFEYQKNNEAILPAH